MSAYANGRGSQILSLAGTPANLPLTEMDRASLLPQLMNELEGYVGRSKHVEAALLQEKSEKKKYLDLARELQKKLESMSSEAESKARDFALREERLKAQISVHEEREKKLQKMEELLAIEQGYRRKYQEQLQSFHTKYKQVVDEARRRLQDCALREDHFKAQIEMQKKNEKALQTQIASLLQQIKVLREEKEKLDLESELLKAHLQTSKQKEAALKISLQTLQSTENSHVGQVEQFNRALQQTRNELNRYKAAWAQVSQDMRQANQNSSTSQRKNEELYRRSETLSRRVDELSDSLSAEKRRSDHLEELMKKEKREKQLALTHLHTAESRLAQLNHALEDVKNQRPHNFREGGLELQF